MKSNIHDFPQFQASIQSDELVYLFGTGISASLTGKSDSWWKWIMDGIVHMKDSAMAAQYEASLKADDSTDNMITIVGKVLKATKGDNTYTAWMQEAFEANPVINVLLAETLKKLLFTQDVFATTNYDLLLEQATGLGTLSYEEPDKAFRMLDERQSTHVLHIHGVYDSGGKTDNIVADQAQYDAVLGNEGAQFIQHILGTRTLIFVGCGKTTEDANIAKFIQFAREHLKMDRDYYFLHKEGQSFDGMPANIKLISYGSEYTDLPEFLEDMAQERLRFVVQKNSLIGRTAFHRSRSFADPLTRYHYSQETIPFMGREGERRELKNFIDSPASWSWWSITGQAGAGKSRLALQCLRELSYAWFGFFLNDKATADDAATFRPFSNTLVVIDYVNGREYVVANIMKNLARIFKDTSYSLRILLIERENNRETGSWYSRLVQSFGKYDPVSDAEYRGEFLDLGDLDGKTVENLVGAVCSAKGLPKDSGRDAMLREAYGKKFEKLRFRPLYVQIFVESWMENGFSLPRYDRFEDLLQHLLQREQERWLSILDGDQPCCNSLIRLLLRANVAGELRLREIPELYQPDWERLHGFLADHSFPGKQGREEARAVINSVCQNMDQENAAIVPLFPDIIKEYMFFYYMDETRLASVMNEIWQNAAHSFAVFITRCMTDFPENDFYRRALNVYEEGTDNLPVLAGRLEMLKKWVIRDDDDPHILQGIIDNEYAFWQGISIPEEEDLAEQADTLAALKVMGLHLVARQYGGWSVYDMSQMMTVIDEALTVPGGKGTLLVKQLCLQENIRELSRTGFSEESLYLEKKMTEILKDAPEDDWNSTLRMQNENAVMMSHILSDDFEKAVSVFKRMVRECSYKRIEAVRVLAHSCFNIEHLAFIMNKSKYQGMGLAAALKLSVLFPDDNVVRVRLAGCRVTWLQHQYFTDNTVHDGILLEQLKEIEQELEGIPLGDQELNEAYDLAWGIAKTLKINAVRKKEEELKRLIEEAGQLLERYPDMVSVLSAGISAVHALHKEALRDKVSHEEVERLFRYVELNYESQSAREAFFKMLQDSEDAQKREDYLTKWVAFGARQDARYNPYGSGLEEFDREADLIQMLSDFPPQNQETFRRIRPKTGANDPCPCGSGKKFKKCCRGNGRYD